MSFHHCFWSPGCTLLWIIADKILESPMVDPSPPNPPPSPHHITSFRNHWGAPQLTSTHFPHLLSQPIKRHSLGQRSKPIGFHCADFYTRVPSDVIAVHTALDSAALISHFISFMIIGNNTVTNDSRPHYQEEQVCSNMFEQAPVANVKWRPSRD